MAPAHGIWVSQFAIVRRAQQKVALLENLIAFIPRATEQWTPR